MEKEEMDLLEAKPKGTITGMVVGSVAGILASTAAQWILKSHAPVMDTQVKGLVMKLGVGLMAGTVGSVVSKDVSEQVDESIDMVEAFRKEVAERREKARRSKEIEINE